MYHILYQYDFEPIEKAPTEGETKLRVSSEILTGRSGVDSSPRFRDSPTDVLRGASQMPCRGIRFGTHAFPARLWQPC